MLVITCNIVLQSESYAAENQEMKYDVFAGGFHVVSADLKIDLSKNGNYHLRLGANTHGFLAMLAPWHGVFETKGWYDTKKFFPQPQIHSSNTTWRDENELVEFVYNKDGTFKEHRIFNEEKNGAQPPMDELSKDTTDVLTASFMIMKSVGKAGKCEGTNKIFDGARSYNLIFKEVGREVLKSNDYNVYAGDAVKCTVEVKPIAGKWHEKPRGWLSIQEQGREKGTMPTLWLAQISKDEPAVPIKIQVKTDYGSLIMHLTSYTGGEKSLNLARK